MHDATMGRLGRHQKVEIEKCLLSAAAYIKDWAKGSHTKRPLKRAY